MKLTIDIDEKDISRLEDLAQWGRSYQYTAMIPSKDPDTAYELYQAVLRISAALQQQLSSSR